MPTTLLVTSTRPGVGTVGEIFLSAVCKLFSRGELYCVAGVSVYDIPVLDPDLDWLEINSFKLPGEFHWQYEEETPLKKLLRKFRHVELLRADLSSHVEELITTIKRKKIELLLLVLNSPSMILIADAILKHSDIPSVAIVWDPIQSITEQRKMDRLSQAKLEERFDAVIGKVKACGVASPGMKEYLAKKGVPTKVLINPVNPYTSFKDKTKDKLIISFAGSIYAHKEFKALLKALNKYDWKIKDRAVELRIFSHFCDLAIPASGRRVNVSFKGHLREHELLEELASSHVAYLPYWFDKEYANAVKICFPNKLATYVAAGCPILYHGPAESTPASFLARFHVGKSVHNVDADNLAEALGSLVDDQKFLAEYPSQRASAISQELSPDIFRSRFLELVAMATEKK